MSEAEFINFFLEHVRRFSYVRKEDAKDFREMLAGIDATAEEAEAGSKRMTVDGTFYPSDNLKRLRAFVVQTRGQTAQEKIVAQAEYVNRVWSETSKEETQAAWKATREALKGMGLLGRDWKRIQRENAARAAAAKQERPESLWTAPAPPEAATVAAMN